MNITVGYDFQLNKFKERLKLLDERTACKEVQFGEGQKAFTELCQGTQEIENWLSQTESKTIAIDSMGEDEDMPLEDLMTLCVESGCIEDELKKLIQLSQTNIGEQDEFNSMIEELEPLMKRQEEIARWIDAKAKLVSFKVPCFFAILGQLLFN